MYLSPFNVLTIEAVISDWHRGQCFAISSSLAFILYCNMHPPSYKDLFPMVDDLSIAYRINRGIVKHYKVDIDI